MSLILDGSAGIQLPASGDIKLYENEGNGINYIALKTPTSVASNLTFTLPETYGAASQALITNGSGAFGWSSILTPSDVGTNVQAYSVQLSSWANKLTPSGDIVGTSDPQSLSNKTLTHPTVTNPVITNYTETISESTGSTNIDLANGTIFKITTNGSTTITLPMSAQGKSFIVMVVYGGSHSITWAGGTAIKWSGGQTPTPTSIQGKYDIFSFFQDGANTYAAIYGSNF